MKKAFDMPKIVVEQFVPNEYVAACGDSGKTYLFTCDAGGGVSGYVYLETNDEEGFQQPQYTFWGELLSGDASLGGYKACRITHEAESTDDFLNGYYVSGGNVTPVIIWRGPYGDNIHCTKNLNMDSWTTAKS